MIFPIGDDNIEGGHKPIVSYSLIAINVAIFVFQLTLPQVDGFLNHFGVLPAEIVQGQDLFTLMTSMFVMGTYLVMFPKSRIKMIFVIFFKTFHLPAIAFLGLWFAQQLLSGVGSFAPATADEGGGVAWWAHIGGFVYGLIIGWIFKQKYGSKYAYA